MVLEMRGEFRLPELFCCNMTDVREETADVQK